MAEAARSMVVRTSLKVPLMKPIIAKAMVMAVRMEEAERLEKSMLNYEG